jgi:hypothetical protein
MKSAKRCWENNETLEAQIEIANFGLQEFENAIFEAKITDAMGNLVHVQEFECDVPFGNGIKIGAISFPLTSILVLPWRTSSAATRIQSDAKSGRGIPVCRCCR